MILCSQNYYFFFKLYTEKNKRAGQPDEAFLLFWGKGIKKTEKPDLILKLSSTTWDPSNSKGTDWLVILAKCTCAPVCLQPTAAEVGSGTEQAHGQASLSRKEYKQQRLGSDFKCTTVQQHSYPASRCSLQLYFQGIQPHPWVKTSSRGRVHLFCSLTP